MNPRLRTLWTTLLLTLVFVAGIGIGQSALPIATAAPPQVDEDLERIQTIWDLVHQEYIEQPLDDEALITGALDGMLGALGDPHTSYMPPAEYTRLEEESQGSYSGIGALVEGREDRLFIVSPYEGSPAEQAGLQPGDEIMQVDDTPISEFDDPTAAISLVRGPKGEPVRLLIRREGEEFEVTVIRDDIPIVFASGRMLEDDIGYIRVASFDDQTEPQLEAALEEVLAEEPRGLVLDLRGNPGGSLNTSIFVASQFIGDGTIMTEEWGNGDETTYEAQRGGLATDSDLPLVVLVDAGSASASEIVAGAIQDYERGTIMGETTYGKGTVQFWHDLGAENGGVRITIARWLTPNGTWVHGEGITPDITVVQPERDPDSTEDLQLESAVAHLLGQPLPEAEPAPAGGAWKCCAGQ